MSLTRDVFATLEEMQQNLRETIRETSALQRIAIEEEVLLGAESITKTCSNMLRNTKRIENSLKRSSFTRNRR